MPPFDAEILPDDVLLPVGRVSAVIGPTIVVQVGLSHVLAAFQKECKRDTLNKNNVYHSMATNSIWTCSLYHDWYGWS